MTSLLDRKNIVAALVLFLAAVLPVTVYLVQQQTRLGGKAAVTPTSLNLATNASSFNVNDQFNVYVYLDTNNTEVDAVDMILRYDPAVIEVVNNQVNQGSIFGKYCGSVCSGSLNPVDAASGTIVLSGLAWSDTTQAPTSPFRGTGEFARILFRAKAAADSTNISFDFTPGSTIDSNVVEHLTVLDSLTTANPLTLTVNSPLSISNFNPTSGPTGTRVTISGSGFGSTNGKVFFTNNQEATIESWNETQVVTIVPNTAVTGPITIQTADNRSLTSSSNFTVTVPILTPTISSLNPTHGLIGSTVSLNGSNFGTSGTITFNGVVATERGSWTDSLITVTVPDNAVTGPVVVTTAGGPSNNDKIFIVDNFPPTVQTINPTTATNSAPVRVTIAGDHFNNPTIYLAKADNADIPGTIVSATSTQIVANFDITNKEVGSWAVVITNADGQLDAHLSFQITRPADTIINFRIRFQGIRPGVSSFSAQTISFTLRNASGEVLPKTSITTAADRTTGFYDGTVTLPNFTSSSGSYEALIKGPKHLAKKFTLASLTPNQNNSFTWTTDAEVLRVGDIYGPGTNHSPDNLVDIWDYTILLAETKNPSAGIRADFDNNGLVDIWDYTYLRANIGVTGD